MEFVKPTGIQDTILQACMAMHEFRDEVVDRYPELDGEQILENLNKALNQLDSLYADWLLDPTKGIGTNDYAPSVLPDRNDLPTP